jgi:hypothetical protein
MAVYVIRDAAVKINSVDLSDHITEVSVAMSADDVDVTAMGAGGRQRLQGIRDDSFTMTALSDFAAGEIDNTVFPLFTSGSLFLVEVWPAGTTTSSTNPKYSGTVVMTGEYTPVSGAIGDAASTPMTFPVNGTITKSTA